MSIIRWMHLSDLHLGSNYATETSLMRQNLLPYIDQLGQPFQYIFLTGDIKEWNSAYTDDMSAYLQALCAHANTPMQRLFLVPGNHDVDTSNTKRTECITRLTDWRCQDYDSKVGLISPEDLSLLQSGHENFLNFVEGLLGGNRRKAYTQPHFVITTDEINVLHADSTLTYLPTKERELILGSHSLMDALAQCDKQKPTILLTHYSFDYLTQQERNEVAFLLQSYNVQLWLAGHEHENLIRWQREKFLECQCGNLVLQNGARSCFLTGSLNTETGEGQVEVHAWYAQNGWAQYPFARSGTENNCIYPFQLRLPGKPQAVSVLPELENARAACLQLSADGALFGGVHINPSLLTDLKWNRRTYKNDLEFASPLETLLGDLWDYKSEHPSACCNALLLGSGGMGKSTMMYRECKRILKAGKLAVYISLQAREGAGGERIREYVLRCLYQTADEQAKNQFYQLTALRNKEPNLVLFVDGFNELTGPGASKYVAELKELSQRPGIQIVVSSRLGFLQNFGMSHFWTIHTCPLRDQQLRQLFEDSEWNAILGQRNLNILLQNPMMALLYASTCSVVNAHRNLRYLDWHIPVSNPSDLLHNYYLAQVAGLLDRNTVDGECILTCYLAVTRILPMLGQLASAQNTTVWREDAFYQAISQAVGKVNALLMSDTPGSDIQNIRRNFRLPLKEISEDQVYDQIVSELCLMKAGMDTVSFPHQIFRDYLAAAYLYAELFEYHMDAEQWHSKKIHQGVRTFLRHMHPEPLWGTDGFANMLLSEYRGKEADPSDYFVENLIACWLEESTGKRDLSGLDLRNLSLSAYLKGSLPGAISIDNAWVAYQTFINDQYHDTIVDLCFSHDGRTLAAVSRNGLVSVTNLLTQSQMVVGQISPDENPVLGFDEEDHLLVKGATNTLRWATFTYDTIENGDFSSVIHLDSFTDQSSRKAIALKQRLQESDMLGCKLCMSEDRKYLAIGFENGTIQVWGTDSRHCIASLVLGDSRIATASFTSDGAIAAIGAGGKQIQIWDIVQGRCIKTLFFTHRVSCVRFLANDAFLECQFSDGTYRRVNMETWDIGTTIHQPEEPFVSKKLLQSLEGREYSRIESASGGNAIVLMNNGAAFTWDEKRRKLNFCKGHKSNVTAIAICRSDTRFAASYSPERYYSKKDDRHRRDKLNGKQLVRVRIIKTGQCQWRLPTDGKTIKKLQFFTTNRIILAGIARNGDILLWELTNTIVHGQERGRWDTIEIVRKNQGEPLECAVMSNPKTFVSAYSDGNIVKRPFSVQGEEDGIIKTFPGINAGVFEWEHLNCSDEIKKVLRGYQQP